MCIIDSNSEHTRKTLKFPRLFITIGSRNFSKSQRKFTETPKSRSINLSMMRAVHGLKNVFIIMFPTHIKQIVFIFIPMPRSFIQRRFCKVRNPNLLITKRFLKFENEITYEFTDESAFRSKQGESSANQGGKNKKVKLFTKFSMISSFCFLVKFQIVFKRLRGMKSCSIDTLNLRTLFITFPIYSSDIHEFKSV